MSTQKKNTTPEPGPEPPAIEGSLQPEAQTPPLNDHITEFAIYPIPSPVSETSLSESGSSFITDGSSFQDSCSAIDSPLLYVVPPPNFREPVVWAMAN